DEECDAFRPNPPTYRVAQQRSRCPHVIVAVDVHGGELRTVGEGRAEDDAYAPMGIGLCPTVQFPERTLGVRSVPFFERGHFGAGLNRPRPKTSVSIKKREVTEDAIVH